MSFLDALGTVIRIGVEINNRIETQHESTETRINIEHLAPGTNRIRVRKDGRDLVVQYQEVTQDSFGKELITIEGVWAYQSNRYYFKPSNSGFVNIDKALIERMLKCMESNQWISTYTLWNKWSSDKYFNATLWGV